MPRRDGGLRGGPVLGAMGRRGVAWIARERRLDPLGRWLQGWLGRAFAPAVGRRAKDLLNGTWQGHPLHPALTDVPLGAWTVTALCDLAWLGGRRRRSARPTETALGATARTALGVGVLGAVGAALSGLADYADVSGAQRRVGVAHAGLNTAALLAQAGSWWMRRRGLRGARALSAVGYGTAVTAAYLGGHLVFGLGTQVDRTAWHRGRRAFTDVMAETELLDERPTRAEADGASVVLVRHRGTVYGFDDTCAHAGCPLSQGRIEGDALVCGCHGSTFRLRDGAVLRGPSPFAQPSYDVRVDDGRIAVRRRR